MKAQRKTKTQLLKELEELRHSEEHYRQLFESANDAIVSLTLDGMITTINRGAEVLLGWPRAEQVGRHYGEFLTPASFVLTQERARRIQAGEKVSSIYEIDLVRKDGGGVPVEARSRLIRDGEGKPIGILAAHRDITERKRSEEALRESEERYRSLFENAYDGIASLTADGIITSVNRGLEAMLGRPREELIGQSYRQFHTPASLAAEEDRIRRFRAGERVSSLAEIELVHKEGRVIPVEARTRFIRNQAGQPIGVLAILRNITERKRAEAALQASEQRYRSLFENANDAIISISLDGTITAMNRGLEVMTGWAREELIGQSYYKITTPRGVDLERERNRRALAGEKPPSVYEAELMRKDGSIVPFEGKSRFIRDREGKPVGHQTILRDITDRKQAEEEKQKLQEQLFQARKLEALGTLASGVAHDFNNILSAVMGFTELATDEVPEGTLARGNLEEVLKACRRAKGLVQQVLTFSRLSRQNHEIVQPHLTVEEVLTSLQASLPPTIEVRRHLDKATGFVALSASQLQQVLANLCANAIQALRERGGVLAIRLQRTEIADDFARTQKNLKPGPHLRLTVSDTGCGMTPEVLERIFEPFFTTRAVGEGSGLGLAIVHGIVTGHGGAVTVESTPGGGTTFQVYLPLRDGDGGSEHAPHHPPPPADADSGDEKGALSGAVHFGH